MTWFNGSADVLYYPADDSAFSLAHFAEIPYFVVPNLARVRNVGVECHYLFSRTM